MVAVAEAFAWPHGEKRVVKQPRNLGLRAHWLQMWTPTSDTERAAIFEDDLQVSPHFFRWLSAAHAAAARDPALADVAAVTLAKYAVVPYGDLVPVGAPPVAPFHPTRPFLFAGTAGSWGLAPMAAHWREFLAWCAAVESNRTADAALRAPRLPGTVQENVYWTNPGQQRYIWSLHFLTFMAERKLYVLCPVPPLNATLSGCWRERGSNTPCLTRRGGRCRALDHPILGEAEWVDGFEGLDVGVPGRLPRFGLDGAPVL